MTTEQMNREVAEWLEIEWHKARDVVNGGLIRPGCSCGYSCKTWAGVDTHIKQHRPDFSQGAGIILLLKEMMKREETLLMQVIQGEAISHIHPRTGTYYVNFDYIIEEGALLKAVWEWSRRQDVPRHNIGNGEYRPTGDKLVLKRRER